MSSNLHNIAGRTKKLPPLRVGVGGNLAPPALDIVPPPKHLTGTGVATAAMLVACQNPITMSSTMEQILHLGRNVLSGQHPWPEA